MKRIGLIRVLTTNDPRLLNIHGEVLEASFGMKVLSRCIPDQPAGVYDAGSLRLAAPKVAELAEELSPDVDGIIISCAADPGLAEARDAAGVPVVGAGSAAAAAALSVGRRVGVLDISAAARGPIADILGQNLVAIRTPYGISRTTELLTLTGVCETFAAGQRLADDGADVILAACTGLSSMGAAGELRRRLGIPVIDPVLAAGAVLASATSVHPD